MLTVGLVPLLLTGTLGRVLDARSFSGFALVLGTALAVGGHLYCSFGHATSSFPG